MKFNKIELNTFININIIIFKNFYKFVKLSFISYLYKFIYFLFIFYFKTLNKYSYKIS